MLVETGSHEDDVLLILEVAQLASSATLFDACSCMFVDCKVVTSAILSDSSAPPHFRVFRDLVEASCLIF